jgi:hypothetical protein
MRTTETLLIAALGGVVACDSSGDSNQLPIGPTYFGKADAVGCDGGADCGDQGCRVVLRKLSIDANDPNQVVALVDAELAEVEAGADVGLVYTFAIGSANPNDYRDDAAVTEVGGGLEGYQRFEFRVDVSGEDEIEVIPNMRTAANQRFWDHNRDPDGEQGLRPNVRPGRNNDNYFATRGRGFEIPLDESKCPRAMCRLPGVQIERAYPALSFRDPTSIRFEPNVARANRRVFVIEKLGRILAFPDAENVTSFDVFLDWSNPSGRARDENRTYNRGEPFSNAGAQQWAAGWEEGFLDLAFHPDWPTVPEVYVTFNSGFGDPEGRSASRGEAFWNLARFESRDGGRTLDPASFTLMIRERKQGLTHNGGSLVFHPTERTLWVGVGTDGGFPLDAYDNSQNPGNIFGSILRLNVVDKDKFSDNDRARGYSIPDASFMLGANPFINGTTPDGNQAARPEVYTFGNRQPWRMSFDPMGMLWVAEVGEDTREEVNLIDPVADKGANFGYPFFEGRVCTRVGAGNQPNRRGVGCAENQDFEAFSFGGASFRFPLFETYHLGTPDGGVEGESVTGGFVYRGALMPDLAGWYVAGDFITGQLLAWNTQGSQWHPLVLQETGKRIASFGENPEGELFFIEHNMNEGAKEDRPQDRVDAGIYRVLPSACQETPPPPAHVYSFLSADGAGSERGARAYYRSILPANRAVDTYTFEEWQEDYIGDRPQVQALYHNQWDLNFWREMHCTQEVGRGVGGCWVTNWAEERFSPLSNEFVNDGTRDLGTVCMNVSEEGYTRFYIFAPDPETGVRRLSLNAVLDDERKDGVTEDDFKYLPHLCTPCHAGSSYRVNGSPDLGSIFREFEPALMALDLPAGVTRDDLERRFAAMNQAIMTANDALTFDAPIEDYIRNELYDGEIVAPSNNSFGCADGSALCDTYDADAISRIPASWREDESGDARMIEAKQNLWYRMVNPFCMTCHRNRAEKFDFEEYGRFRPLDRGILATITGDPTEPEGHPRFMPQTMWLYERMNGSCGPAPARCEPGQLRPTDPIGIAAVDSLEEWFAALAALDPPTCAVTYQVNGVAMVPGTGIVPGIDVFITGQVASPDNGSLGSWTPWEGLQLDGSGFPNWTGTVELEQGALVEYKVAVVDRRPETRATCGGRPRVYWEFGPQNQNRVLDVPSGMVSCMQTVVIDDAQFQNSVCD